MDRQATEAIIDGVVRRMTMYYLLWGFIYISLGLATVILPILITVGVSDDTLKILAPLTAIVAAVFAFLKPHEYATGFDAGKQEAWKTQIAYSLGQMDDAEVAAALGRAIDVTTFKYGAKISERLQDSTDKPG